MAWRSEAIATFCPEAEVKSKGTLKTDTKIIVRPQGFKQFWVLVHIHLCIAASISAAGAQLA